MLCLICPRNEYSRDAAASPLLFRACGSAVNNAAPQGTINVEHFDRPLQTFDEATYEARVRCWTLVRRSNRTDRRCGTVPEAQRLRQRDNPDGRRRSVAAMSRAGVVQRSNLNFGPARTGIRHQTLMIWRPRTCVKRLFNANSSRAHQVSETCNHGRLSSGK